MQSGHQIAHQNLQQLGDCITTESNVNKKPEVYDFTSIKDTL